MTRRRWRRGVAGLVLFLVGLVATVFLLATDDHPAVVRAVALAPDHVERVKDIVDRHRYRVARGTVGSLTVRSAFVQVAAVTVAPVAHAAGAMCFSAGPSAPLPETSATRRVRSLRWMRHES